MIVRWLIPLLFALPAFAAGGACPAGANYYQPSSTGGAPTLVTLSSLGVTSCYYFAASGSNTNNGTTESTPLLDLFMTTTCTNDTNCAAKQTTWSGTPAGIALILRGGDTWHFGNSGASPYEGAAGWAFNNSPGPAGTNAHPIYVGVDIGWYAGGSFARPILTGDNAPNSSQVLGSCTYPTAHNPIDISGGAYYIIDNFEMTGVCTNSSNWNIVMMAYGSLSGWANFYNLYIHGWSHVGFPNPNNCTANSTCMSAFRGSVSSSPPGETLLYDVVDGGDSDPVPMELCYCGAWRIAYSYFNNGSQFITRDQNSFHDSAILNFVDNGHANVMESVGDSPGPSNKYAFYNNLFGHLYAATTVYSNVCFWPFPTVGSTLYWFNNVVYDAAACEFFNMGQNGSDQGTIAIFNATFQFKHRTDGGAMDSVAAVQAMPIPTRMATITLSAMTTRA